jgi:hypothetical protein
LEVPLRDRNALLLAAGYAPVYHETPFDAREMAPVRAALDSIVRGHEPYPAVVVDRRWDLVTANDTALRILTDSVGAHLLTPRANALRGTLHPDGLGPRIENLAEWAHHLLERLDRQVLIRGPRTGRTGPGNAGLSEPARRVRPKGAAPEHVARPAVRALGPAPPGPAAPVLQHVRHLRDCLRHHHRRAGGRVLLPGDAETTAALQATNASAV